MLTNKKLFKMASGDTLFLFEEADKETGKLKVPGTEEKTFTQDQVNTMLAENKKDLRETNRKQAEKLLELSKGKDLSDETIEELKTEAERLNTEHLTETEKTTRAHALEVKTLKESGEAMKTKLQGIEDNLNTTTVNEAFLKAATDEGALKPKHILGLLPNKPTVKVGEDGVRTVTVKIGDKSLSPDEAVKAMKADVKEYGDYFSTGKTPGGGGGGNDTNEVEIKPEDIKTEADYLRYDAQQAKIDGRAEQAAAEKLAAETDGTAK